MNRQRCQKFLTEENQVYEIESYPEIPVTKALTKKTWTTLTPQSKWQFYHWFMLCTLDLNIVSISTLIQKQGRIFNYLNFLDMMMKHRLVWDIHQQTETVLRCRSKQFQDHLKKSACTTAPWRVMNRGTTSNIAEVSVWTGVGLDLDVRDSTRIPVRVVRVSSVVLPVSWKSKPTISQRFLTLVCCLYFTQTHLNQEYPSTLISMSVRRGTSKYLVWILKEQQQMLMKQTLFRAKVI